MSLSRGLGSIRRGSRTRQSVLPLSQKNATTTSCSLCSVSPLTLKSYATDYACEPRFGEIYHAAQRWQTVPQHRRYIHSTKVHLKNTTASPTGEKGADTDSSSGDIICSVTPAPAGGQGTIASVTLSNPGRLNSLNSTLISKLISILRSLASQSDLRCVVIQGAVSTTKAPAFTSGANIYEMAKLNNYGDAKAFISRLHEACQAMRDLPVVTIAQIHGLCLGGGLELAAACDSRYATRTSSFSMPETKYGIPSVIEARLLANIIGWQKTKEMVYLAKFYDAEEMQRWGLVDMSCEDIQDLEEKVTEVVKTVTSYGPETMRAQKRLVRVWEENDLVSGVDAGVDAYASMFKDGGSEPVEYMKIFTERK